MSVSSSSSFQEDRASTEGRGSEGRGASVETILGSLHEASSSGMGISLKRSSSLMSISSTSARTCDGRVGPRAGVGPGEVARDVGRPGRAGPGAGGLEGVVLEVEALEQ